jgi:hypothetical protein
MARSRKLFIAARVYYAAAMTDGHTAPELANKGQSAKEIATLWKNIKACLHATIPEKVTAHAPKPVALGAGIPPPRGCAVEADRAERMLWETLVHGPAFSRMGLMRL